jgi:monoterpene epsilon-lactone hydrolase
VASPQLQVILEVLRARPPEAELTIEEARAEFEGVASQFLPAGDVRREPVDAGGVPGEWISTPESAPERVIYYLHGGAYFMGSVNTHRELISRLSRAARARAIAIDYRLAPENPFPAAVEDSTSAYRWLISTGVDPARLVIAGDSAGGGLTLATLVALRDAGEPLPAAAVCLSPWVDLEGIGESMITRAEVDPMIQRDSLIQAGKAYLGDADPHTPLAAPLYADLRGLPPMLIQVGTAEALLDDATRFAERARAAGVEVTLEPWDDMFHVWQFCASILPEGQAAIDRIGEFVRKRTG